MDNTGKFTGRQVEYAAGRPSYAISFLAWLRELYAPPEHFTAADIGSGTGKLTVQLLESGFTVYGVEPNADMRRTAETLLNDRMHFISVDDSAASSGLADQSVDFVTAAQAFHWFDGPAFARECRRILRPEGQVFLIWNTRTDAPLTQALARVFREYCPDFRGFSGGIAEDDEAIRAFFNNRYEKQRFSNPLTFDRAHFLQRCFSASYSLRDGDGDYPAYRQALTNLFDTFAVGGQLFQPNETLVYTGTPLL